MCPRLSGKYCSYLCREVFNNEYLEYCKRNHKTCEVFRQRAEAEALGAYFDLLNPYGIEPEHNPHA